MKVDHIYYKNDLLYSKINARLAEKKKANASEDMYTIQGSTERYINEQVTTINKFGTYKMKIKAALFQTYHHALHNRFNQAKELLLKTHISEIVHLQDITTQILYNRAITQIGIAAFRLGNIEQCHEILVDIMQTTRLRESLAQGVSKMQDKPLELEKEELKRQIPFHMHINLQLLDCVYMVTAMLLEIPNIAENQYLVNKKIISKNFHKMINQHDTKAVYLTPENYRDIIVAAAKQLNKSSWKKAVDLIFSIKLI